MEIIGFRFIHDLKGHFIYDLLCFFRFVVLRKKIFNLWNIGKEKWNEKEL